jgi:alkanesulfonate monooxygenase SsuD/methylene tetrahydromethanopterin reductase-like flavin-dependent oxidoreductase (luciferase family)
MTMFGIRYDLRCPAFGSATSTELATALVDQCEWADRLGFVNVTLSEHHGSEDGYLPSPLVMAAAIASRTKNIRITIGALIIPLHDPIRVAEDMAMVDVISNGRLIPILSAGYVKSEFDTFGVPMKGRGKLVEEAVEVLEKAWTGEPFEYRGATVRVTPRPVQRPRPPIFLGGSSNIAARRAARIADGFLPSDPKFFEVYREECVKLGKPDPGAPAVSPGTYMHVAEDPDAAWEKIAPHAMHEMNAYGKWSAESGIDTTYKPIDDPDELRAGGKYPVMTPDELIEECRKMGPTGMVTLHPLMGGTAPELAWESLRLIESKVLPAVRG